MTAKPGEQMVKEAWLAGFGCGLLLAVLAGLAAIACLTLAGAIQ